MQDRVEFGNIKVGLAIQDVLVIDMVQAPYDVYIPRTNVHAETTFKIKRANLNKDILGQSLSFFDEFD